MTEELLHHAMGPSSSDKWITCAGAYLAEQGLPDTVSSYAEEGTAAHTLAEWVLNDPEVNCDDHLGDHIMLGADKVDYYVTEEMADAVQEYVDYVRNLHNKVGGELFVEVKVDISRIWPGNFGTSDAIIVGEDDTLYVIDLKYGAGITVNAHKNNQGLCYAIGAYDSFDKTEYAIKDIEVHIVQPRKDHIDSYALTAKALLKWADKAYAAYLETQKPNPKRTASPKGCQWCKAKGDGCKAYVEMNFSVLVDDFAEYNDIDEAIDKAEIKDSENISLESMIKISKMSTSIKGLLDSVNEMLTVRALAGEKIDGHKVVRGPGGRFFKDVDAAYKSFTTVFDKDIVAPRVLKTPPQLEKLKDKDGQKLNVKRLFEEHVGKSEGNLLLRLETAKGKAIDIAPAEEDYAEYDEVDEDW